MSVSSDEALTTRENSVDAVSGASTPPDQKLHGVAAAGSALSSQELSGQETQSSLPVTSDPAEWSAEITPDPVENSDRQSKPDGPNPFSGSSQFFSIRGFMAASSLFLLTFCVCVMAIDVAWSLAISVLFAVAISTGHLVFYTRDRHVRERAYFGCVALGTFLGGALIVDLQLTHPYFINHRVLHELTSELVDTLQSDSRFTSIRISTENVSEPVARLTGTVRNFEDRTALRILVEDAGFVVGTFEVRVIGESQHTSRSSEDQTRVPVSG